MSIIPHFAIPPSPDLTGVPVQEVIERAKDGFSDYVHELSSRIEACYEEHSTAILDALVPHLNVPQGIDIMDLPPDVLTSKTMAIAALTRVNVWLILHPTQTPLTITTSLRLFSATPDCIRLSKEWFRETSLLPDELHESIFHGYQVTATFFASLVKTPTRIIPTLAAQSAMLDLAIGWWTSVCVGYPIMYPCIGTPKAGADPGMAVFRALIRENPTGMARAIVAGRTCDPRVFVERTMARLRFSARLNQIKHLSHLPDSTPVLTRECVLSVLDATRLLRRCDAGLHELFRKAKALQTLLEVLQEIQSAVPQSPDLPAESAHAEGMLEMLDLVVDWVVCTPTDMITNLETLVNGGFVALLAHCVSFAQEKDSPFMSIMNSLMPYAAYPKVFNALLSPLRLELVPKADYPRRDSPESSYLRSLAIHLGPLHRMLSDEIQERLCDNLQHAERSTDINSSRCEMVCSGCHTVSYCSKACQSVDWKALHHLECPEMRNKYMVDKSARSHYPYRYRKYHASLTRDRYEAVEIVRRTAAYTRDQWRDYDPCGVSQSVIILPGGDPDRSPAWSDSLEEYIARTDIEGIMPSHLKPRFNAFVSVFRKSILDERSRPYTPLRLRRGPGLFKIPNDGPGAIRFVERSFRWGPEREKNVVLLIEQVKETPVFVDLTPSMAEMRADAVARERSYDGPLFKIFSSFVYECTRRAFTPLELVHIGPA